MSSDINDRIKEATNNQSPFNEKQKEVATEVAVETLLGGRRNGLTAAEMAIRNANRGKARKLLEFAIKYGVVKLGWTATDYMRYAIENYGWESTGITGLKGSAKSNLLIQRGYAIYKDYKKVFAYMFTTIDHFLALLETAIETKQRIPWTGGDDIATLFPRSLYFTDRKLYSELKSAWETTRTIISNFDWTATRKNKVASFITDDITGDIITYNRVGDLYAHFDYRRWLWQRDFKDPNEMKAKLIAIEDTRFPLTPDALLHDSLTGTTYLICGVVYSGKDYFERADLGGVTRDSFIDYWDHRLELANASYKKFKKIIQASRAKDEKKLNAPDRQEWGRFSQYKKKIIQGKPLTPAEAKDYAALSDRIHKSV